MHDLLRLAALRSEVARAAQQRAWGAHAEAQRATARAIAARDTLVANADTARQTAIRNALAAPASLTQMARLSLSYRIAEDDITEANEAIARAKDRESETLEALKMRQSALAQCLRKEEKLGQIARTQTGATQQLNELLEEFEAERAH